MTARLEGDIATLSTKIGDSCAYLVTTRQTSYAETLLETRLDVALHELDASTGCNLLEQFALMALQSPRPSSGSG